MSRQFQRPPLWRKSLFASFLSLGAAVLVAASLNHAALQLPQHSDSDVKLLPPGSRMRIGAPGKRLVGRLVFSPDGTILAIVGYRTYLWDVATGKHLRELSPKSDAIPPYRNSIIFSRDGRTLLGVSSHRTLASWDVATGKEIRTVYSAPAGKHIDSLLISPDGKQLVVELSMAEPVKEEKAYLSVHHLQLWDLVKGKLLRSFEKASYHKRVGDGAYFGRLAISPDGKTVTAADQSGTIVLWDVATGKILREIPIPYKTWEVSGVAFSPDSKFLISCEAPNSSQNHFGGVDRSGESLRIREVTTGKEHFTIPDVGEYGAFAMSPDGRTFALSDGSPIFRLFEYLTGQELLRIKSLSG